MKTRIKRFYYNYLEINGIILFIFLLSVFAVIDIKLRFFVIPEPFKNGSLFENDIYNLSIAYLASFIFYYLVVFLPEKKDRRLFHTYVSNQINQILRNTSWIVSSFIKNDNPNRYPYQLPEDSELKVLIAKSKPSDNGHRVYLDVNGRYVQIPLWQTIVHNKYEIMSTIDRLNIRAPQFDNLLTKLLMEIEECALFYFIDQNPTHYSGNNFKIPSEFFIEYYNMIRKISNYTADRYGSKTWDNMFDNRQSTIEKYETERNSQLTN